MNRFTIICAIALMAAPVPEFAQAGSTGGKVGKQDKSASGGEVPARAHRAPARKHHVLAREQRAPRARKHHASQTGSSQYLGCFKDQGDWFGGTVGRDINGSMVTDNGNGMTSGRCIVMCRSLGFAYAGVQASQQCFCGNHYGHSGTASNCNMPCPETRLKCAGGAWANSVYRTR